MTSTRRRPSSSTAGSSGSAPADRLHTARSMTRDVRIRGDVIRLGELLKLAGVVGTGGEAKAYLVAERVLVNGEPESRRGRQLRSGDEVETGGETLRVVG